jgi:hypothetical protein
MRRSFKPMQAADHIEDEDERCRVRNQDFVARTKRRRERKKKMVFGILYAAGIVLCVSFFWLMSR